MILEADASRMTAGMAQGARSVKGFQGSVIASAKLTTSALGVAVPLAATTAGVALGMFAVRSFKAARDYEAAFTRISAISNATASDIERWRGEVMDLSGETAKAPVELADALFFLSSAGLESGQVMEALTASAKASAVGLGSTVDVANITASALNAYADAGLTAAQVTDTLVAAVREGRAEPEAFAGALGRILPIAAQAGVSFDEITASLASLSNIGLDVDEAVTAMRGALQAIAAPGSQAAEAMDQIGLSAQDLLDAISEQGLFGAFQLLDKAARQSTQGQADYIGILRKVIPNVRALTGVLGLTGQEAKKVRDIYDAVANSAGSLDRAFAETSEGPAFQLQQALQEISNIGMEVASTVLPALADALQLVAPVLKPVASQFDVFLASLIAFKVAGPGAAAGVAAIGLGIKGVADLIQDTDAEKLERVGNDINQMVVYLSTGRATFDDVRTKTAALNDELLRMGEGTRVWTEYVRRAAEQGKTYAEVEQEMATEAARWTGLAGQYADSLLSVSDAHEQAATAAREQRAAELALQSGLLGVIGQANELQDAQAELNKLQKHGAEGTERYREATARVLGATISLKEGLLDYAAALDKEGSSSAQVIASLKGIARESGLTGADVRDLIADVRDLIGKYGDVPSKVQTTVVLNAGQALTTVDNLYGKLAAIERHSWKATIIVYTEGGSTGFELIEELRRALDDMETRPWEAKVAVTAKDAFGFLDFLKSKDWRITVRFVGAVREELDSLVELIRNAAEGLEKAELERAERFRDAWLDAAKAYRLQAKELEAQVVAAERQMDRLRAKVDEFRDAIQSGFAIDLVGGATGVFSTWADDLARLTAQRMDLLEQIAVADIDTVQGLRDQLAEVEAQLAALPSAGETITDWVEQQVRQAVAFADVLTQLAAAGLSQANIAELAAQGPQALAFGEALLANPQLIGQLNEAQRIIAQAQADVTRTLVEQYFGSALREAGEELRQAQADVRAFAQELARFVETLNTEALDAGIKAVVRGLEQLAGWLEQATPRGAQTGGRMPDLGTEARPTTTVNVTVNGWVGNDQEIARRIRDELVGIGRNNSGVVLDPDWKG